MILAKKNSQNWPKMKKTCKIQTVDKIFWNLFSRCFATKENATKKLFFEFGIFFGLFWAKKQSINSQNWPKMKKTCKIQTVDEIFWNLFSRCFATKGNATKNFFRIWYFVWPFLGKKAVNKQPNWPKMKKIVKIQTVMKFSEICQVDAL